MQKHANDTEPVVFSPLILIFKFHNIQISLMIFLWCSTTQQVQPDVVATSTSMKFWWICCICWGYFDIAIAIVGLG
jgi:hypothetical protein